VIPDLDGKKVAAAADSDGKRSAKTTTVMNNPGVSNVATESAHSHHGENLRRRAQHPLKTNSESQTNLGLPTNLDPAAQRNQATPMIQANLPFELLLQHQQ
jgi:hypothetical protein